jgi:hypothetical protein
VVARRRVVPDEDVDGGGERGGDVGGFPGGGVAEARRARDAARRVGHLLVHVAEALHERGGGDAAGENLGDEREVVALEDGVLKIDRSTRAMMSGWS